MKSKKYALLVIDMQNDFWDKEGLFAKKGIDVSEMKETVEPINELIEESRKIKIPVIFVYSEFGKDNLTENIWERYLKQGLIDLCLPKSKGAEFFGVDPRKTDLKILKHRYDAFTNPELENYLREEGINTLILVGGSSDVCVDSTARTGFQKGFFIIAVEDCLVSLGDRKKDIEFFKKYYDAKIVKHQDLIKELK